ncbi:MAG TPA: bifunctional DNA primase/polymerase, partial [Chloroflexota bacterium]|nr:bifunctional DNA primase/polymerase [Chloroflexota bacterium]
MHSTTSRGDGNVQSGTSRAAHQFANDGFYVLPLWWIEDGECACRAHGYNGACKPGKHPIGNLVPNAHADATIDPAVITTWFTLHPKANVGIALGPSGLVDVAPDSIEWFAEFVGRGLPLTMHFASGGGSGHEHWLYRRGDMPAVRIARRGKFDVLSDGYCVAPPSTTEREYRWIDQVMPVDVPQWVCQFVLDYIIERDQASDEAVVPAGTDVPPVNLFGDQWAIWNGQVAGDRSNMLVDIARMLSMAGCTDVEVIASVLAERDVTLGLNKYATRRDASRRYREIALRYGTPPLTAKLSGTAVPHIGARTAVPPGDERQPPTGVEDFDDPLVVRNHQAMIDFHPPATDWLIEPIIAKEWITENVAKVKLGKTTFAFGAVRAGLAGDAEYCGFKVHRPFRTLYFTEEWAGTFSVEMEQNKLNDLVDVDGFFTVLNPEVRRTRKNGKPFTLEHVFDSLIRHCHELSIDLVVLDTLSIIAAVDEEDHSGRAARVMEEVRRLSSSGFAVYDLRHSTKRGGEIGDAGRGSSAYSGGHDILTQMESAKGDDDAVSQRKLFIRGRGIATQTIFLDYDAENHRYTSAGPVISQEEKLAASITRALIDNEAFDQEHAMTTNAVTMAAKGQRAGLQRELVAMADRGDIYRAERGPAKVYWIDRPLQAHITGVVPTVSVPAEPVEPQPPTGVAPVPDSEPGGTDVSPPPLGGELRNHPRKEPSPETVAKRAAEKAAREL